MYRRYHGIIPSCDPQHSYTVTLERDDASTSHPMRELTFYGEGFTLEREPQDTIMTPILPTRLVFYLQSEANFQFEHIARDTHEWTARLQLDDKTIFLGRIETGLYEEDFAEPPYEVRLTATCGLQSLYDRDLIAEEIPVNQAGVISVRDFINHLLKGAYPGGYQRNSLFRESVATEPIYIDPLAYDSSDKPLKEGEVLETLLHDLCLNVRSSGGLFVVAPALYFPANGTPYKLGSQETPIYATPQLQSDRGIGQLHLTLPSEETPTLVPYRTPQDPVPTRQLMEYVYGAKGKAYTPGIHQIAVTPATTAQAPSADEQQRSVTLKLSNTSQNTDQQGVLLGTFIESPFWKAPIEVTVPMRATMAEGKEPPRTGDIQLCIDAYLCYNDTATGQCEVCYQATIGNVYTCFYKDLLTDLSVDELEQVAKYYVLGSLGLPQLFGMRPKEQSTAGWTRSGFLINAPDDKLADELEANRNYSKVPAKDLFVPGEFADFHFTFLPPMRHLMEFLNDKCAQSGKRRTPTPNYILLRISSDFWHIVDDSEFTRFYPDRIDLGKVTVKYQSKEDKEHPYTEWLTADRATTYLRRLEEQLTYATSEANLVQPIGLRYKLLNEQGDWLPTIQGGRTLVEYFSEQYMRAYARPYDTLTATVRSQARPHGIDLQQYSVKGRPGRTYYAMGSLYHPGEGSSEELTLIEVPTSQTEETRFTS